MKSGRVKSEERKRDTIFDFSFPVLSYTWLAIVGVVVIEGVIETMIDWQIDVSDDILTVGQINVQRAVHHLSSLRTTCIA